MIYLQVCVARALLESVHRSNVSPEFDEADFNVTEDDVHPDEVALTDTSMSGSNDHTQNQSAVNTSAMNSPSRPLARSSSSGSTHNRGPQTPVQQQTSRPKQLNGAQNQTHQQGQRPPPQQYNQNRPQQQHNHSNSHSSSSSNTTNSNGSSHQTPHQPRNTSAPGAGAGGPPGGEATGFFSARAVKEIPEDALATGATLAPQAGQVFNPRAESPSIRKTPGIDHTKSKPLGRNGQHLPPPSTQEARAAGAGAPGANGTATGVSSRPVPQQQPRPGNVVNPQFDVARRIGAPGGPGSPLANRGQYRPPTIVNKRPLEGNATGMVQGRAPLADVSNSAGGAVAMGISGPDVKRLKMG
jgi:DNA repair and recombination protein RAD52